MSNTIGCANEMHDKGKQKKKSNICWINFHVNKKKFATRNFFLVVIWFFLCDTPYVSFFHSEKSQIFQISLRPIAEFLQKKNYITIKKLFLSLSPLLLGGSFCSILK